MTNQLSQESSPYLLQHANNPVDWFPWCDAAQRKSKELDRPIFLSIGYSACHWCHVMEHESFEDASIARVLNENFVSIKVDREERPDLDQIYMNAVMALRGGGGGWPLSVFLTPDQEVFFGGTYWPPKSRVGTPGFDQVLLSVLDAFHSRREQVNEQSKKITQWLNGNDSSLAPSHEIPDELLSQAVETLERSFDFDNGGFGSAPKFPHPMDLQFLIQMAMQAEVDSKVPVAPQQMLDMVTINLKKMAYGGIFDHLAGGFARYSVDEKWLVPHFEKMLYDNSLLANTFLDMHVATGDPFFSMIARKTLDYLLNYMVDEAGGFQSTEDADSEGVEGKFYVWSRQEILQTLGAEVGSLFCELYNVTEYGNFEGANILNMSVSYDEFAADHSLTKQELRDSMRVAREQLLQVRDRRIRPAKDDKILVSWNALAISAMSRGAVVLGDNKFLDAASNAARFIQEVLTRADGRLLHTYRNGEAKLNAYADDYAYLINSLIDLYEASFRIQWLDWAVELSELLIKHFWDEQEGGLFFTSDDHEALIARTKSYQDSSVPSGNSIAATAFIRIGRLTGETIWLERAENTIRGAVSLMERSPMASGQMLIALAMLKSTSYELVIVTDNPKQLQSGLEIVRQHRPSNSVLICYATQNEAGSLKNVLSSKAVIDGEPTLYICQDFSCNQPAVGLPEIESRLRELTLRKQN